MILILNNVNYSMQHKLMIPFSASQQLKVLMWLGWLFLTYEEIRTPETTKLNSVLYMHRKKKAFGLP